MEAPILTSIARHSPAIVAGSALTGFGLAFGRDAYRKAKDKWLWLIILLLFLIGVFFAGIWLFRNYRTVWGTLFKKLGALIVLAASCAGVNLTAAITIGLVAPGALRVGDLAPHSAVAFVESPLLWIFVVQAVCFLSGAIVGIGHRRKRALAWEAEEHNERFLAEHGLLVTDTDEAGNLRIRDTRTNTGYRMAETLDVSRELEFVGLGRSRDYAYIQYDATGKFTEWSGPVGPR